MNKENGIKEPKTAHHWQDQMVCQWCFWGNVLNLDRQRRLRRVRRKQSAAIQTSLTDATKLAVINHRRLEMIRRADFQLRIRRREPGGAASNTV